MYNYKNCNIVHNTFVDCSEAIDFRSVSMSDSYGKNFYAPADGSNVKAQPLTANLVIADNVIRKDRMSGHDTGGAMIRYLERMCVHLIHQMARPSYRQATIQLRMS